MSEEADTPTTRFQVGGDRWRCCYRIRKTDFCSDCGRKRPEKQWSSRVDDILETWKQEKHVCEKTAQTLRDKMTEIEIFLEDVSKCESLDEVEEIIGRRIHRGVTIFSSFWNHKNKDTEDLDGCKQDISSLAEAAYSQTSAHRDAKLRKAAQLNHWIETVTELIAMIPTPPNP